MKNASVVFVQLEENNENTFLKIKVLTQCCWFLREYQQKINFYISSKFELIIFGALFKENAI